MQGRRQNDGQDRQHTGVDQGQQPRKICKNDLHGAIMRHSKAPVTQIRSPMRSHYRAVIAMFAGPFAPPKYQT